MKWTKREIAYQHVHMFYGFWASFAMYIVTGSKYSVWTGCFVGLLVEVVQYYTTDQRQLFLFDRIRDWQFWNIGGNSLLLVVWGTELWK